MAVFREDSGRAKDKLPLEHMSLDDDLRFFLEIFYNMEVIDYHCDGFYAGVMLDNHRKLKLGVNVEKLAEFSIDEQIYILAHEGGHIVFDHMLRGERWVNKEAANIAADAVLNTILNKQYQQIKMPRIQGKETGLTLDRLYQGGLIKDADLQNLKKQLDELTTDDVYDIIMTNAPKIAQKQQGKGQQGQGGGKGQGKCPHCGKDPKQKPDKGEGEGEGEGKDKQDGQGQGQGQGEGDDQQDQQGQGGGSGKCPHCGGDLPQDQQGGGGPGGDDVLKEWDKQRLDSHDNNFSSQDLDDETKTQIEELIRQAKSGMYGDKAGNFVRDLMNAVKKHFPFKQILDKIIFKEKYDFAREHRRIQIPNGYLPRRRSEKIKVYAMIDVSGSVYDYTEDFIGYIMALEEFEELVMIDTEIQAVYKKGDPIPKVVPGGGGTDLNPAFQRWYDTERSTRGFKLNFVCLTDGEIPGLTVGPVKSKVLVLTTNNEVYYDKSSKRYMNIKIARGDYE